MAKPRSLCRISRVAAALGLLASLLTGCWDRLEIEERAVVLGIGIDLAGAEAERQEDEISHSVHSLPPPKTGMLRVTVQIAVPGRIPLGPGAGGGGAGAPSGGGGGQNTVWVVEGVGHTLDDAVNNLQQRISPPLFFGHLRIIVLSEALARRGIENLNDFFHRNSEVRRMNWMFICEGEAIELMKASPQLERVPTIYLMNTMDQSVKMGRFPNQFLGMFWSASSSKGREGFLPYVKLKSQGSIQLNGLAYFRNDQMVGVTDPIDIPIYMGILGQNPAGGQAFVKVPGTKDYVLFGARNRKSSIRPYVKDGKPHMSIEIMLEGNLLEKANESVQLEDAVLRQIEQQLIAETTKAYRQLIRETQEKGADIFGFGEQFRGKLPRYWDKEIRTKAKWQQMYRDLSIDLNVSIHLRRIGMKAS